MARRNLRLVYGGATVGLMGVLADTVLAQGGEVMGVIPSCLVDREIAHQGVTMLETVDSMHARKERMAVHSDAFVLLPGGFGSLEEIFEAITWNQLGIHNKPCAILNVEGYYDTLLQFTERAVTDGFVCESDANELIVDDDPLRLISTLIDQPTAD